MKKLCKISIQNNLLLLNKIIRKLKIKIEDYESKMNEH